jgi:hypothetical protein
MRTIPAIILAISVIVGAAFEHASGSKASDQNRTEMKMTSRKATAKPSQPIRLSVLGVRMAIVKLSDGTLMGCFSRAADSGQEAAGRYSRHSGRTRSDVQALFTLPQNSGAWRLSEALVDRSYERRLGGSTRPFLQTALPGLNRSRRPFCPPTRRRESFLSRTAASSCLC